MLKINKTDLGVSVVTSTGALVPVPDFSAREDAQRIKPAEVHALGRIGNAVGLNNLDIMLKPILERDNTWNNAHRENAYDGILKAVMPLGVHVSEAKRILSNKDLRPEVVAARAAAAIEKGVSPLSAALEAVVRDAAKPARFIKELRAEAFRPDPSDPNVQAHAREVRDVLRNMTEPERVSAVLALGKNGKLHALDALRNDPLGTLLAQIPGDIMESAENTALEAVGLGFLFIWEQDAEDDLAHIASVAEVLRAGILRGVPGGSVDLPRGVKPLGVVAKEALAA